MKTLRSKRLKIGEAYGKLREFLKRVSRDEKESKYHKLNTRKLKEVRAFLKRLNK